jgi:hypothetical protein
MRGQETTGTRRAVRKEAVPLKDAVGGFLRASGLSTRMRHLEVFSAWNRAVGESLARRAKPVRFERGDLVVEVDSAAHHQELVGFTGDDCRERANQLLARIPGGPTIRRAIFRLKR